jgi:hypothetical protein
MKAKILQISSIIKRSLLCVGKNPFTFLILLILYSIPWWFISSRYSIFFERQERSLLLTTLFIASQGILTVATFNILTNGKANIGNSILWGLKRFLSLFVMVVIIGAVFYSAFYIKDIITRFHMIPAIIFIVIFLILFLPSIALAVPICVLNKLGPIASLNRSSQLTKGHRLKIILLYSLVGLVVFASMSVLPHIFTNSIKILAKFYDNKEIISFLVGYYALYSSILIEFIFNVACGYLTILSVVTYHSLIEQNPEQNRNYE